MNKNLIRIVIFIAALLLSTGLPLIWEVNAQVWTAVMFLVLSEILLVLVPAKWMNKFFPMQLPMLVFIFPCYFTVTLIMVLFSTALSWKWLMTIELISLFLLIASCGVCMLNIQSKENKS